MKQNELLTIIVAILIKKNKKRYIVYIYHCSCSVPVSTKVL